FAGYLAQWVDIGFQRPALVKEIVARFSRSIRSRLPLQDYLYLRLAEGMIAMSEEAKEEAIAHLDFVLGLEEQTDDKELLSIANFWKGRCLRMKGEYDEALAYAVKGRELAMELGHEPMAAVMRVLESWLWFQKGNAKQALQILQEAEAALSKTDDHLTLGNIHSSYGRIARRQGRYQHAIEHFTAAIYQQYRNHHGLGSVHLNYGYLHLDNGDLEYAEREAKAAFQLGEEKGDHILMARARLLQCMIENVRVEEEIGDSSEPGGHARLA